MKKEEKKDGMLSKVMAFIRPKLCGIYIKVEPLEKDFKNKSLKIFS